MTQSIIKITFFLLVFSILKISAQEEQIGILAKYQNDNVKLKIIPKKAFHWLKGIENGYIISRREVGDPDYRPIHDVVLKPASQSIWLQANKGQEMFDFHNESVTKIATMIENSSGFLSSFQQSQRADENYKLYIIMTMRDKTFGDFSGLEWTDSTAIPGKMYEYKVSMQNTRWESKPIIFSSNQEINSPSLDVLSQDKNIRLSWIHDESLPILGYYIEKSETGLQYEKITEAPIWPTDENFEDTININRVYEVWHQDSLQINYQPYYYRLVALDAWGDEWEPSEPVVEMGRDFTPPKLGDLLVKVDSVNRNFILSWEASTDSDLKSYFITQTHRTKGQDTVFIQDIDPSSERRYTYENPIEMKNYYFKIGAIDTSGNYDLSDPVGVFINDITPPELSKNVTHEVDSLGTVMLTWDQMRDPNPLGYWVFKSYNKDENFIKITDTVYDFNTISDRNTLGLLHHHVFYYVKAVDQSFNLSIPSDVIRVILPDTIPPSATYISSIIAQESELIINWHPNQSEDVERYHIYKKVKTNEWQMIGTVPFGTNKFAYEEQSLGEIEFKILAKDESENIARLESISKYRPLIEEIGTFDLSITNDASGTILSWEEIGSRYRVYAGQDDQYKLLEYLETNSYTLQKDNTLDERSFYVKAYNKKGRQISISQIRKI